MIRAAPPDAGLSLVEVLVALALFALIGTAGFAMLDAVARVQSGTDGRLDRLVELERAMHLVCLDFEQIEGGLTPDRGGLALRRPGGIAVRYDLAEGALRRRVTAPGLPRAEQRLVERVAALTWRYDDPGRGWVADWPPPQPVPGPEPLPRAVALDLTLTSPGLAGHLTRVVRLPQAAQ